MSNQEAKSTANPWVILILVLLAATAAPLALFKVPTVMIGYYDRISS